ncbi:unnamed protein product, partial [Iphiclides podalirius]
MDKAPVPKPRSAFLSQNDGIKRPVPLPRTKEPGSNDRVTASDILRSISTVSKQITEDVASKVSNSAKTANDKIERSIQDGSKFAKGTLEKTLNTSRAMRDTVAKSVIEGTRSAGLKLRKSKKLDNAGDGDSQRQNSLYENWTLPSQRIVINNPSNEIADRPSKSTILEFDPLNMGNTVNPTNSILKESYTLDSINSMQIVLPLSSSTTSNSYCFELSVAMGGIRNNPRKVLFSCASASERRSWAQKIAEHLTSSFPTKYTAEFTRCGWCYIKEGVSGEWYGAWLMLIRRVLIYSSNTESGMGCVDLRKTRCVVMQAADDETKHACPSDGSGNLLLGCPLATLYLRFPHERELKGWRFMIKLAAHNNGAHIHHQQLTKEDIPTIVDKCISFIFAYGSLSEGIYRRAGSSVVLAELLARFRRDAWSVQLIPGQHSEHDVAGVLKRFFRDLPDSLIPQDRHAALTTALELEDEAARYAEYRRTLNSLGVVARNTARKLFAHLHFLQSMAHANKMNAENLASVWAPTIMPAALASNALQTAWSSKEVYVVRDLIANYEAVWRPTQAERAREAAVRRVLTRVLSNAAPAAPRTAGDLRAWVYVHDRHNCYQIVLTPNKTKEVICNDAMRRIVHIDEIVLDVVLRWGYWDEEDRKDNYLLVKENKVLQEMDAMRHTTSLVCGELRLANESSKSFKLHMFEFNKTKLCYFKDKQGSQKIDEWDVKDILWYVGHEPKRNPQSRWAITFIPRNNKPKRSKERPWFGCTVAGAVTEDQLKWTAAMMFAEHTNVLPSPRLVIT